MSLRFERTDKRRSNGFTLSYEMMRDIEIIMRMAVWISRQVV